MTGVLTRAAAFLMLLFATTATAQDAAPTVFQLLPTEGGTRLEVDIPRYTNDHPFTKEPAYEDSPIRGALPFGQTPREHMGFAWDAKARTLYLDQNRNLDLTDDTPGGFPDSAFRFTQRLQDIRVDVPVNGQTLAYLFTLEFEKDGVHASIRSGWQGDIRLHGAPWRLYIADNLDGVIGKGDAFALDRLDPDNPEGTTAEYGPYPFPETGLIFLDGRSYVLGCTIKETGCQVEARPATPEPGEIAISGQFIDRLVLSGSQIAILDSPPAKVPIPTGDYSLEDIRLRAGDARARYRWSDPAPQVTVTADKPVILHVGGPLSTRLDPQRTAGRLDMTYQAVGVGGEPYHVISDETSFRVFKGDRQLGRPGDFRHQLSDDTIRRTAYWRVPVTGFGTLRIEVDHGPEAESLCPPTSTTYDWRPLWSLSPLVPWLIPILLMFRKANRAARAGTVFLAAAIASATIMFARTGLESIFAAADRIAPSPGPEYAIILGLTTLWLVGDVFAAMSTRKAVLAASALLLAVGAMALPFDIGLDMSPNALGYLQLNALLYLGSCLVILYAFSATARAYRNCRNPKPRLSERIAERLKAHSWFPERRCPSGFVDTWKPVHSPRVYFAVASSRVLMSGLVMLWILSLPLAFELFFVERPHAIQIGMMDFDMLPFRLGLFLFDTFALLIPFAPFVVLTMGVSFYHDRFTAASHVPMGKRS